MKNPWSILCIGLIAPLWPQAGAAADMAVTLGKIQTLAKKHCDAGEQVACSTVENAQHLAVQFQAKSAEPPAAYLKSLDLLADSLQEAEDHDRFAEPSMGRGGGKKKKGGSGEAFALPVAFSAATQDLGAKTRDFELYGPRLVPVTIRVLGPGPSSQTGWEVFYKCTYSGLSGAEQRADGLTETVVRIPATASCSFRAHLGNRDLQAGPIPVSQAPNVRVDIPLP